MTVRYYKISEVAELLEIEQHTLRYLENALKLNIKRNERSDRLYTEADLETLRLVLALKSRGLNTTAIKMALENTEEKQEASLPVKSAGTIEAVELFNTAREIVKQNETLMLQNNKMEERLERLEKKLDQRNLEREQKIDEFLELWKMEQNKNKPWFNWLRGK